VQKIRKEYDLKGKDITTIYNGIDSDRLDTKKITQNNARQKFPQLKDKKRIVTFGDSKH